MVEMEIIMEKIIKGVILIAAGFILGAVEENLRYSIIHHEAKKGDPEAQEIVDQFDKVGMFIENKCRW